MSTASAAEGSELIVAPDGSIPADQIARLGIHPGAHLRVLATESGDESRPLAGALPEFPDLSWEDFEKASELVQNDLASS